jgi:hypothetical protein
MHEAHSHTQHITATLRETGVPTATKRPSLGVCDWDDDRSIFEQISSRSSRSVTPCTLPPLSLANMSATWSPSKKLVTTTRENGPVTHSKHITSASSIWSATRLSVKRGKETALCPVPRIETETARKITAAWVNEQIHQKSPTYLSRTAAWQQTPSPVSDYWSAWQTLMNFSSL